MQIRRATIDDINAIYSVRTSVKENHMTEAQLAEMGVTRESTKEAILNDALPIWCAFVEDQLVGFSSVLPEERELFALFVLPEFEGKKIGSALHDVAVNWLFDKNPHEPINLNTEKTARAFEFYQQRGWVLIEGTLKSHMLEGDVLMQLSPSVNLILSNNYKLSINL